MIHEIEQRYKDQFNYLVCRDVGKTNRFECTVYKNQLSDEGTGVLIHSRLQTNTFVHEDYEAFLDLVEESIK